MHKRHNKPLHEQVIVITGASSGIGLATALAAAEGGARLVLAARSANTLSEIVEHIQARGGQAVAVPCDVADRAQVERVSDTAIEHFGRIDTWVNNAGGSIYGRLEEVSDADNRRLFDTNFWGVCNGSFAALPHLRRSEGTLINLGSDVSEGVLPLLGMYSASKHAVKGFTDALRVEVEDVEKAPVSITLIQPTAVDTPFPQHARNYMDREPRLPSPKIDPHTVARAILGAAVGRVRSRKVGAMATLNTLLGKIAPELGDKMAARQAGKQQLDEPPRNPAGALYESSEVAGPARQVRGNGADHHASSDR
jgi:short-subunit dehydrogenase